MHVSTCGTIAFHERRDDQARQKAEHHAGQAGHHFDRRLDARFQAADAKTRSSRSPPKRQRRAEQHRVNRRLERAEHQRHQAELRFRCIAAAGALPGVFRLRAGLRTRRAETACPASLRDVERRNPNASCPSPSPPAGNCPWAKSRADQWARDLCCTSTQPAFVSAGHTAVATLPSAKPAATKRCAAKRRSR